MYTYILSSKEGEQTAVAVITLNRSQQANAMLPAMALELESAIKEAILDPEIGAIVVTGAGKHFCAGADAQHIREVYDGIAKGIHPSEPFDGNLRALHRATSALYDSPKPTIAAINGSATAGGLDLALACDYRFAVSTAKFGESYVKLGLPPLNGGAWLLRRIVGPSRAFRMLMTGEVLDSAAALTIRLVDEVLSGEDVKAYAVNFAMTLSRVPADLQAFIKAELRAEGGYGDALARAYVAGVGFTKTEYFNNAIKRLPRPQNALLPGENGGSA
jgi:enoyl-CoA hydratase/carnithine racemase